MVATDGRNNPVDISQAPYWFIDGRDGNVTLEFNSDGNIGEAGFFIKQTNVCRVFFIDFIQQS